MLDELSNQALSRRLVAGDRITIFDLRKFLGRHARILGRPIGHEDPEQQREQEAGDEETVEHGPPAAYRHNGDHE
nr:hypothetical protein [Sphingobium fuliginis]